ncbi:hypothetical protein FXO38_34621 [Capsicum annuum]|nr:hypothetical protein FXO38_34621 [Capsicum annuum]KAF3616800.1 hypothetical protein FXO37_34945 [Capsicum annuum]
MKRWHDSKIIKREFHVGDDVLLFNSRLKLFVRKLRSKWSGSFIISNIYPNEAIELEDHEKKKFMVNGQKLKHYYMGVPRTAKDSCSAKNLECRWQIFGTKSQQSHWIDLRWIYCSSPDASQTYLECKRFYPREAVTFCPDLHLNCLSSPSIDAKKMGYRYVSKEELSTRNGPKVSDVQATIDRTRKCGKESDNIRFSMDGVKKLYHDWVTTRGFNLEKVFSMKGVGTYFHEIITEVREWLARVIIKCLPPWVNGVGQIKRRDILVQANHWLSFVGNRLLPSINNQDITIDRAIIVGLIMDKIAINPGELIAEMIKFRSKKSSTLLPFPTLISLLCLKFKVLLLSKIDRRVIYTRVIEITLFKDEDNPIGIKNEALALVDSSAKGLSRLEGMEIPLDSALDAETHQDSTNTPSSSSTTPPPQPT